MSSLTVSRRDLLRVAALALAITKVNAVGFLAPAISAEPAHPSATAAELDEAGVATLEAFADTVVPGEKRSPSDRAIAGATDGPGAVQAGAVTLLEMPEAGLAAALPQVVAGLNGHATGYAANREIPLDSTVPPFVSLDFADRTALTRQLTTPGHPEQSNWATLALIVSLAFDNASQMPTTVAIETGHPGIATLGLPAPDADGLWRFPQYSYGRQLARPHPGTTAKGSPT